MPIFVLPFKRSFPWMARAFDPAYPSVGPKGLVDVIVPTLDVFGTERLADVQHEDITYTSVGGVQEVASSKVPADRCRYIITAEWWHDNAGSNVATRPGIVVSAKPPSPAFPFTALQDTSTKPGDTAAIGTNHWAIRRVWIPPNGFFAIQTNIPGAGPHIFLRFIYVEVPIGERIAFE